MLKKQKKNDNEILLAYKFAWEFGGELDIVFKEIEEIAKDNPKEFQNLLDIFNNEKDLHKKLMLSEILMNLKHLSVKNFFLDLITLYKNDPEKHIKAQWTKLDGAISAALSLAKMKDERGVQFLKEIISAVPEHWLCWIESALFNLDEPENISEFELKLLLELMDICEGLGKYADRQKVEKKLEQLRKQGRAKTD